MADTNPLEGVLGEVGGKIGDAFQDLGQTVQSGIESASQGITELFDTATDKITDTVETVAEYDYGKAFEGIKSFTEGTVEKAKTIGEEATKGNFQPLFSTLVGPGVGKPAKATITLDQEEEELKNEFNNLDGWQNVKDFFNLGKTFVKEKITGSELENSLAVGVEKKSFEETVKKLQEEREQSMKAIADIQGLDPRYSDLKSFQDNGLKEYLAMKNIATVDNAEEFAAFMKSKFDSLDPTQRQLLSAQQNSLSMTIAPFEAQVAEKSKTLEDYLNTNVTGTDGKTGAQRYEEILKNEQEKIKNSKLFSAIDKVRKREEKKIEEKLVENVQAIAAGGGVDEQTKDAVLDNMTARRQYFLSLYGMDSLPENKEMAMKFLEGAEIQNKLDLNILVQYSARKNSKEFEGMSESEKKQKIKEEQWKALSDDEKRVYAEHESVITSVDVIRELDKVKKMDSPLVVLNALSAMGSLIQKQIDKAFTYADMDGVPHYVEQETRSTVFANENWAKKGLSIIAYNPDAFISVGIGALLTRTPAKGLNAMVDFAAKNVGKIVRVPLNVGFGNAAGRFATGMTKEIAEGVLQSASADAVIDNLMVEAPTDATEAFNRITGMFFDPLFFSAGKGITAIQNEFRPHELFFDYMTRGDRSKTISEIQDFLINDLKVPPEKVTKESVIDMMNEHAKIYSSTLDPREIKRVFNEPGALQNFILTSVRQMDQNKLKVLMTEKGFGLRIEAADAFGTKNREDFENVSRLAEDATSSSISKQERGIAQTRLIGSLRTYLKYAEDGISGIPDFDLSVRKMKNDNEAYQKILTKLKTDSDELILADEKLPKERKDALVESFMSGIRELRERYALNVSEKWVYLINPEKGGDMLKVRMTDLYKMESEGTQMNFEGLRTSKYVKVVKETAEGIKPGQYQVADVKTVSANKAIREYLGTSESYDSVYEVSKDIFGTMLRDEDMRLDPTHDFSHLKISEVNNPSKKILYAIEKLLMGGEAKFDVLDDLLEYLNRNTELSKTQRELEYKKAYEKLLKYAHGRAEKFFNVGDKKIVGDALPSLNSIFPESKISETLKIVYNKGKRGKVKKDKEGKTTIVGDVETTDVKGMIEEFQKQPGLVNVNGGYFYAKEADIQSGLLTNNVYLTFGKDMKTEYPNITDRVEEILEEAGKKKSLKPYANGVAGKLKNIISFSVNNKTGQFDFINGMRLSNMSESLGKQKYLSFDANGEPYVDAEKIKDGLRKNLEDMLRDTPSERQGERAKAIKEISEFIADVVTKTLDKSMFDAVELMVEGYMFKIREKFDVISKIVRLMSLSKKPGDVAEKYKKAIANVLIDPFLFEKIAEHMDGGMLKMSSEGFAHIEEYKNQVWERYVSTIKNRIEVMKSQLESYKSEMDAVTDQGEKAFYRQSIEDKGRMIEKLEGFIESNSAKKDFQQTFFKNVVNKSNLQIIENVAESAAVMSLIKTNPNYASRIKAIEGKLDILNRRNAHLAKIFEKPLAQKEADITVYQNFMSSIDMNTYSYIKSLQELSDLKPIYDNLEGNQIPENGFKVKGQPVSKDVFDLIFNELEVISQKISELPIRDLEGIKAKLAEPDSYRNQIISMETLGSDDAPMNMVLSALINGTGLGQEYGDKIFKTLVDENVFEITEPNFRFPFDEKGMITPKESIPKSMTPKEFEAFAKVYEKDKTLSPYFHIKEIGLKIQRINYPINEGKDYYSFLKGNFSNIEINTNPNVTFVNARFSELKKDQNGKYYISKSKKVSDNAIDLVFPSESIFEEDKAVRTAFLQEWIENFEKDFQGFEDVMNGFKKEKGKQYGFIAETLFDNKDIWKDKFNFAFPNLLIVLLDKIKNDVKLSKTYSDKLAKIETILEKLNPQNSDLDDDFPIFTTADVFDASQIEALRLKYPGCRLQFVVPGAAKFKLNEKGNFKIQGKGLKHVELNGKKIDFGIEQLSANGVEPDEIYSLYVLNGTDNKKEIKKQNDYHEKDVKIGFDSFSEQRSKEIRNEISKKIKEEKENRTTGKLQDRTIYILPNDISGYDLNQSAENILLNAFEEIGLAVKENGTVKFNSIFEVSEKYLKLKEIIEKDYAERISKTIVRNEISGNVFQISTFNSYVFEKDNPRMKEKIRTVKNEIYENISNLYEQKFKSADKNEREKIQKEIDALRERLKNFGNVIEEDVNTVLIGTKDQLETIKKEYPKLEGIAYVIVPDLKKLSDDVLKKNKEAFTKYRNLFDEFEAYLDSESKKLNLKVDEDLRRVLSGDFYNQRQTEIDKILTSYAETLINTMFPEDKFIGKKIMFHGNGLFYDDDNLKTWLGKKLLGKINDQLEKRFEFKNTRIGRKFDAGESAYVSEVKEIKNLSDLYSASESFKNLIDSLIIKDKAVNHDEALELVSQMRQNENELISYLVSLIKKSNLNIYVKGNSQEESIKLQLVELFDLDPETLSPVHGKSHAKLDAETKERRANNRRSAMEKIRRISSMKENEKITVFNSELGYIQKSEDQKIEQVKIFEDVMSSGSIRILAQIKNSDYRKIKIGEDSIGDILNYVYESRKAYLRQMDDDVIDELYNKINNRPYGTEVTEAQRMEIRAHFEKLNYHVLEPTQALECVKYAINMPYGKNTHPYLVNDPVFSKLIEIIDKKNVVEVNGQRVKTYVVDGEKQFFQTPPDIKSAVKELFDLSEDEYLMGGFGDKDGIMMVWKFPPNASVPDTQEGRNVALQLAEIEYSMLAGHYVSDVPLNDPIGAFNRFVEEAQMNDKLNNPKDFLAFTESWQDRVTGFQTKFINKTEDTQKRESATVSNHTTFDEIKIPLRTYVLAEMKYETIVNGEYAEPSWIGSEVNTAEDYFDFTNQVTYDIANLQTEMRKASPEAQTFMQQKIAAMQELLNSTQSIYSQSGKYEDVGKFLDNVWKKDLQDGTSFVSEDVISLRARIAGHEPEDFRSFKDHMLLNVNGKGNVLGKTNFNGARVSDVDGNELQSTVLLGESSAKLKGGYKKYSEPKYVYVDGRLQKVVGEIEGTDTSMFRNAESESKEVKEKHTISDSIKNRLDIEYAKNMTETQRKELESLVEEMKLALSGRDVSDIPMQGSVNQILQYLSANYGVGISSNSVVNGIITHYLSKMRNVIEKYKSANSTSVLIRESNVNIKANQVILSKKNKLVIKAVKEKRELAKQARAKGDEILAKKLEYEADNYVNVFTVGYRYPVPSEYNLGTYEVLIAENYKEPKVVLKNGKLVVDKNSFVKPYENIGEHQSVLNPIAVYGKLEGDNDGDHVFFVNVTDEVGKQMAESSLKNIKEMFPKKEGETIQNYLERIKTEQGGWEMDFITTEQIDAQDVKTFTKSEILSKVEAFKKAIGTDAYAVKTISKIEEAIKDVEDPNEIDKKISKLLGFGYRKIYEQVKNPEFGFVDITMRRGIALKAKTFINNVSASIRTFSVYDQTFSKLAGNEELKKSTKFILKKNGIAHIYSVKDLEERFDQTARALMPQGQDGVPQFGTGRSFSKIAASILQITLDFAKSKNPDFPKNWHTDLVFSAFGLDPTQATASQKKIAQDFYDEIVGPPSISYNQIDFADINTMRQLNNVKKEFKEFETIMNSGNVSEIIKAQQNRRFDFVRTLYSLVGEKRELAEFFIKETDGISPAETITLLNQTYDLSFTVREKAPITGAAEKIATFIREARYNPESWDPQANPKGVNNKSAFVTGKFKENDKNVAYLFGSYFNKKRSIYMASNKKEVLREYFNSQMATEAGKKILESKVKIGNKEIEFEKILNEIDFELQSGSRGDKSKIENKYMTNDVLNSMDANQRFLLAITATMNGEYKLFAYMGDKDRLEFLKHNDAETLRIKEELGLEIEDPILLEEFLKETQDLLQEIKNAKEGEKSNAVKAAMDAQISSLEDAQERLSDIMENGQKEIDKERQAAAEATMDIPEYREFYIPKVEFSDIDSSPQAINELVSAHSDIASKAKDGWLLTVRSIFNAFMPDFYARYTGIRNLLNRDISMVEANRFHVKEWSDGFMTGARGNLYKMLKEEAGLTTDTAQEMGKVFQRALIMVDHGTWKKSEKSFVESYVKSKTKDPRVINMLSDESFMKRLFEYQDKVMTPVTNNLNIIQRIYKVNIKGIYKDIGDAPIVTDLMEASKNDAKFALKMHGINDEKTLFAILEKNGEKIGRTPTKMQQRILANILFAPQPNMADKVLQFLQAVHYNMTYGIFSTVLTQNSVLAGLSQIAPNYVELKAYLSTNQDKIKDALYLIKRYGIADAESVLRFQSSIGLELTDNWFNKSLNKLLYETTSGVVEKLGGKRETANKAGEIVNAAMTNMLGFNDWPLEQMRKVAGVIQAMESWGIKDVNKLEDVFRRGGQNVIDNFAAHAEMGFLESGGGVVSSGIGRGTIFDQGYAYFDNFAVKFAIKSLGYLMGWAFHKTATLIEKETALYTGLKLMYKGDYKAGISHVEDFFRYNMVLSRQFAYAAAIHLKFQKYEKDHKDRMTFSTFQKSFNNTIVAFEILFGRHIKDWGVASQYSIGDAIGYTTYGIFNRIFRLFKQADFASIMYDKYQADIALTGKGDMADAFMYAFENKYAAYMSISGMRYSDDIVNSMHSQANLGVFGVGGTTVEDELFANQQDYENFVRWKDKGSIMAFVSQWTGLFKDDTSPLGYKISVDMALEMKKRIQKDPELSKLLTGGKIGTGEGDYNIVNVVGKNPQSLSPEQLKAINDIWNKISYSGYSSLDSKNVRTKDDGTVIVEAKEQKMLEDKIDKALKENGIDIKDMIENSQYTPEFTKTLVTLELKNNLKTPLVLAVIMKQELNRKIDEAKEAGYGKKTGMVKNGYEYITLTDKEMNQIKRAILIKYQPYINLDNTTVHEVMEQHVRTNFGDTLDKFSKNVYRSGVEKNVMDMLRTQQLVRSNMVLYKDVSSVTKLESRYAIAMKGMKFDGDEDTTKAATYFTLKWLEEIENSEFFDSKTKLAHQAAVLYGLDKTQYGILRNNARFNELTEDSQRLLTNWLYKVSSESLAFDSKSFVNGLNESAGRNATTKKPFTLKPKSKAFSGPRPNFSKQFDGTRDMLDGKQGFIKQNPRSYLSNMNSMMPQSFGYNPSRNPMMNEYVREMYKQTFFGFDSRGVVQQPFTQPQEESYAKTYKIAKAKKKLPTYTKPKKGKYVSRSLLRGLPLAANE